MGWLRGASVPGFFKMKDTRKGAALQRASAMVMLTLALSGCAGRVVREPPTGECRGVAGKFLGRSEGRDRHLSA